MLANGDVLVAETNAPAKPDDNKGIKGWITGLMMGRAGAGVPSANRITLLRPAADGTIQTRSVFLEGLNSPFGMALIGNDLYVANTDALVRYPYQAGQTRITDPGAKVVDQRLLLNKSGGRGLVTRTRQGMDEEADARAVNAQPWGAATRGGATLPAEAAVRLWHRGRDFDRGTHERGRHSGAVGPTALQVLHALIFDFLNNRTGRLDPSYEAIARKARVCVRAVAAALSRLRELGILNWVRRCAESWRDGRFVLEQQTNAYAVLPDSQWRGYRPPLEAPVPRRGRGVNRRPCRMPSRWRGWSAI